MNPPSPAEIFDALFVILVPGAFLIAITWFVERKMDAPVDHRPRTGRRVPAAERRLWGDDWRDPVRSYFRQRFEDHLRVRLAIAATCGADPDLPAENNEDRAATTAGPQDKGDTSNASTEH